MKVVIIGLIPVVLVMRLVRDAVAEIPNLGHIIGELNVDENIRRFAVHREDEAEEAGGGYSSSASSRDSRDSGANHFDDTLSDDPPADYPTYTKIPQTGFSCGGKVNWHYYADVEADCQVFHVCETQYSKISFLCPEGSVFNQRHLVCDWWYNFDCLDAESLYTLRDDYDNVPFLAVEQHLDNADEHHQDDEDRRGFDLSLAQSGGNTDPSKSKKSSAAAEKSGNTTTPAAPKDERRRGRVRN